MSNEEKYEITVRYPEWQQADISEPEKIHKYPAFGVKYLFITSIIPTPDWEEDDERWFTFDAGKVIEERFIEWYKKKISPEFNGEVLFIEPSNLVVANDKEG